MKLFSNQVEAIEKLNRLKVGALFMEPGTGKTRTAYELAKSVQDIDYLLWLAPYRTINAPSEKNSLPFEVNKCGGMWTNHDFIGIESLSNSDRIYLEVINKIRAAKKPMIIVDESLKIKNWEAKRTKRILEFGKHAEYKLILNGTPISRNLLDLWAQMEFLSPMILRMDIAEYKNTYCEYTVKKKRINGYKIKREFITGYHNIEHLYSIIAPYVYECDLSLGVHKRYNRIEFMLTHDEHMEYEDTKEMFLNIEHLISVNNNIFLSMIQKLQKGYSLSSNKIKALKKLFKHEIDEQKTIIFCKYIETRKQCEKLFPNALVLTYGKHSFGLNLQDRNVTVFFDKTFDYAQRLQAENRTYRTGQTDDCQFYDFDSNAGLCKLINKNISRKETMLDNFRRVGLREIIKHI